MSQRRKHSLMEAAMNTLSGLLISVAAGMVIYPMFGYQVPLHEVTAITIIFTVISVIRSYFWRRLYNWLDHHGGRERMAKFFTRFHRGVAR